MIINYKLLNRVRDRAVLATMGVNPIKVDRVFRGTNEELEFLSEFIKYVREHEEQAATLDTAALLIAERDAELIDLRESIKASGLISMGVGERRDPEGDQE
jgi:hypothetical protein